MGVWLSILGCTVVLFSLASLGMYAWDKRRALRGGWRLPEKRLHLMALLGGWPGACLAQRWLRHKTVKRRFRVVFWLTVAGHVIGAAAATYAVYRWH